MMMESLHPEAMTVLNVYAFVAEVQNTRGKKWTKLEGGLEKSTIAVGDSNTPLGYF